MFEIRAMFGIRYRDCKFVKNTQAESEAAEAIIITGVLDLEPGLVLCLLPNP